MKWKVTYTRDDDGTYRANATADVGIPGLSKPGAPGVIMPGSLVPWFAHAEAADREDITAAIRAAIREAETRAAAYTEPTPEPAPETPPDDEEDVDGGAP